MGGVAAQLDERSAASVILTGNLPADREEKIHRTEIGVSQFGMIGFVIAQEDGLEVVVRMVVTVPQRIVVNRAGEE